jgi:hypothetical protein
VVSVKRWLKAGWELKHKSQLALMGLRATGGEQNQQSCKRC